MYKTSTLLIDFDSSRSKYHDDKVHTRSIVDRIIAIPLQKRYADILIVPLKIYIILPSKRDLINFLFFFREKTFYARRLGFTDVSHRIS